MKRLLFDTIMESINEAGFRKFNKGGFPTQNQANQKKGILQISYCKADKARSAVTGQEKEYISVYLGHVWKDSAQKLVDAINSAVPKHIMNAALAKGNDRVVIRVNIDMKDEIPNVIAKLENSIKQLGEYSDASVETVCTQLYDEIDSVAVSADVENARNTSISNWQEMLEKLNDPEVRKRLLKYQTTNDYANTYGHVLSPSNVKDILDQFPTASFVVEKSTWRKQFNREVQPGAQRIVVTKPVQTQPSMADLDDAARMAGFNSFRDARMQTKNATQVMSQINMLAKKKTTSFIKVVMYDVSQTIPPSDPSKDVWTNTIGLSDNITGVLNDPAQSFDDKITGGAAKAAQEANKEIISQTQAARWKNRRYALTVLLKKKNINISSLNNLSDEDFIGKASYLYAQTLMPLYGIVKQDDINRISAMCAAATCMSSDCKVPSDISRYIYNLKQIPLNDVTIAYTITHDILPRLSGAVRAKETDLQKNINNESVNKVKAMLSEESNQMISPEEFFKMCQQEFGHEEGDEVLEAKERARRYISGIVKECIMQHYNKK